MLSQSSDQDWGLLDWERYVQAGLEASKQELSNSQIDSKRFSKTFNRLRQACPSLPHVDIPLCSLVGQSQLEFQGSQKAHTSEFLESLGS